MRSHRKGVKTGTWGEEPRLLPGLPCFRSDVKQVAENFTPQLTCL